jgi:hypothetical protein
MILHSIRDFQEKGKSVLCHGVCAIRGDIRYRDTQLSRDTYIDDIEASGNHADILQSRQVTQALGVEVNLICD